MHKEETKEGREIKENGKNKGQEMREREKCARKINNQDRPNEGSENGEHWRKKGKKVL